MDRERESRIDDDRDEGRRRRDLSLSPSSSLSPIRVTPSMLKMLTIWEGRGKRGRVREREWLSNTFHSSLGEDDRLEWKKRGKKWKGIRHRRWCEMRMREKRRKGGREGGEGGGGRGNEIWRTLKEREKIWDCDYGNRKRNWRGMKRVEREEREKRRRGRSESSP